MEVEENPRLGWDSSFSQEVARRGEEKRTPPYIDSGKGPTT